MHFLTQNATDPYFNMAFDEFCLESLDYPEPVFYLWQNAPAVIIGLNQSAYAEVNLPYLQEKGIQLVRRVTGGGAVYHDLGNLNYTIMGRSADLQADYPGYLLYMRDALRALGVPVSVSGRNDILLDGRKCSGYAKRVYKDRLMVHGTLMYDVDLETLTRVLDTPGSKLQAKGIASVKSRVANLKEYLPGFSSLDEVQAALQEILSAGDETLDFPEDGFERVRKMRDEKFSTWEFIYGHSHEAGLVRSAKLPCGTVEAHITVDRGLIKELAFFGDFLFSEPTDVLASKLIGRRLEQKALLEALAATEVSRFFQGTEANDLVRLIVH